MAKIINGCKICKICKENKKIEYFAIHNVQTGALRSQCKECYKIYRKEKREADVNKLEVHRQRNREYYYKNREYYIQKNSEYQKTVPKETRKKYNTKTRLKKAKEWREWKKTLKCSKCEENDYCCLEFHHLDPSKKEGLITNLRFKKEELEEELKKCIVLCSNCHRKEHKYDYLKTIPKYLNKNDYV